MDLNSDNVIIKWSLGATFLVFWSVLEPCFGFHHCPSDNLSLQMLEMLCIHQLIFLMVCMFIQRTYEYQSSTRILPPAKLNIGIGTT